MIRDSFYGLVLKKLKYLAVNNFQSTIQLTGHSDSGNQLMLFCGLGLVII